jgi:hypothetical protein
VTSTRRVSPTGSRYSSRRLDGPREPPPRLGGRAL